MNQDAVQEYFELTRTVKPRMPFHKKLTGLLCAASILGLSVSHATETVHLTPDLTPGFSFQLQVSKERERKQEGKSTLSGRTVSTIAVRVHSADENGYLLEWRYKDFSFISPKLERLDNPQLLRKLAALTKNTRFLMRFNARGELLKLENHAEARSQLDEMWQLIETELPAPDMKVSNAIRDLFNDENAFRQLLTRDVLPYFNPMLWGEFEIGKHMEFNTEIPNPMGGPTFSASGEMRVGYSQTADKRRVRIDIQQKINPAGLSESLNKFADRVGKAPSEVDAQKMHASMSHMTINDQMTYFLPQPRGWPEKAIFVRRVHAQGGSQVDRVEFIRLPR